MRLLMTSTLPNPCISLLLIVQAVIFYTAFTVTDVETALLEISTWKITNIIINNKYHTTILQKSI